VRRERKVAGGEDKEGKKKKKKGIVGKFGWEVKTGKEKGYVYCAPRFLSPTRWVLLDASSKGQRCEQGLGKKSSGRGDSAGGSGVRKSSFDHLAVKRKKWRKKKKTQGEKN